MAKLGSAIPRVLGQARGSLDALTQHRIGGWAAAPGGVEVEVWLGDRCVGRVRPDIPRPDVAAAFPGLTAAGTSGFSFSMPDSGDDAHLHELRVVARSLRRWVRDTQLARINLPNSALQRRLAEAGPSGITGPFPQPVIDAIAACWPQDCTDLASESGQLRFLARLQQVIDTPEINAVPALCDYARFARTMLAHCRFVERHFPVANANSAAGASDFHCKPNSVKELFAIIHQLYVLKSAGVAGDFAEFGCFKGYSSSMLSFACAWLGLRMHIFDSFAGLPEVEGSSYQAGQFTGGLDEVRANIRQFGSIEAVEFHPGFFADSLRDYRPPALACLWMDVDLEASARDLMVAADVVDPRGSLFSHECPPDIFVGGEVLAHRHPDNPIPPLLDRFAALDRPLTGHHIAGFTGTFWNKARGVPVASSAALDRIMQVFG